jgi:hypothetical protein
MPLPGFQKTFQRLPLARQILLQWAGLMGLACFLLSSGAALMMNRLDLHLQNLEDEVVRIAWHSG